MKPSDKVAAKLLRDMAGEMDKGIISNFGESWIEITHKSARKLLARYERWKKSVKL